MKASAEEKTSEIELLSQKLQDVKNENVNKNTQINSLVSQVATFKSSNDQLAAELDYKQMLLDEVAELMNSCSEIESLTSLIEKRTRDLFNLDNTCLHIFKTEDNNNRKVEILDIRKASPRLLDIPRNNPAVLDPALREGRPVVINAQITPDKSASVAISNGHMQRLVAYIPVRHQNKVLGIMMIEKFGYEDNPELVINMLSYYLKHSASAIKHAIASRDARDTAQNLHSTISRLSTQLESIKSITFSRPEDEETPFARILNELSHIVTIKDAVLVRINNDESIDICSRIDRSRQLNINDSELEILALLKTNPRNKITAETADADGNCIAYPLLHKSRLLGVLFLYYDNDSGAPEEALLDFCVKLLNDHFTLYVMNEEREIWESFYRETLSA
jgi:GAF domain-containing protein